MAFQKSLRGVKTVRGIPKTQENSYHKKDWSIDTENHARELKSGHTGKEIPQVLIVLITRPVSFQKRYPSL